MTKNEIRPPEAIKPNPHQPRKKRDPEAFAQLVESVRQNGILQAPGILEDDTVLFGWGRVLASIEAGLKEIPVLVFPSTMALGQQAAMTLTENMARSDLSHPEVLLGLETAMKLGGLTQKQLAVSLGLKEPYVSRFLHVGKNPLTREPFLAGKLNLSHGYQITLAPADAQQGLLNMALSGPVTREDLARSAKPPPSEQPDTAKTKRISIPLPKAKASVSVTGDVASVDGLIGVLTEALELARKSLRENHSLTTATRAWSDRAKAKKS